MSSVPRFDHVWTPEEDQLLRKLYPSQDDYHLFQERGISLREILARARVLYLKKIGAWTPERFMAMVEKQENGCWIWQGRVERVGYGVFMLDRKPYRAHRYSYEVVAKRTVTKDALHHICENKRCVNPDHLQDVTFREHCAVTPDTPVHDNLLRTHCVNGHEFTPENTYLRRQGRGFGRMCRICTYERNKRYYRAGKVKRK